MKVGLLGATFDPVHRGHLAVAAGAGRALGLDRVLFVPAGQPRLKSGGAITPAEHRVAMVRLAVADTPEYEVSDIEVKRPGDTRTVDTLTGLRREYAGRDEIYFILGWDSLAMFTDWREPSRIIEKCFLAAVPRPGWPPPDVPALERAVPGISQRLILLEGPHEDISSTRVRELAAAGKDISGLVPAPVAGYIKKHGLYLPEGA